MPSINKFGLIAVFSALFLPPFGVYAEPNGVGLNVQNRFKDTAVQIGGLPELGTNSLGVTTGLPLTLWKDANISKLEPKILKIANNPMTPAMRNLFIRLMITDTGGQIGFPIETRLQALSHIGAWDDMIKLIDLIPPTKQTDDIQKQKAEALFLSGTILKADKLIQTLAQTDWSNQMRLAIAVATGNKTGAELIFATGLETNDWDELTKALGQKLLQNRIVQWPEKMILKPYHIHMAAALGTNFPWEKAGLTLPIKKALVHLETAPIDKRILWAEQTAEPHIVAQLYQMATQNIPSSRTGLFKNIVQEKNPEKLVALLNDYLDKAKQDGLFIQLAGVVLPYLNTIQADKKYADLGFNAAQVYALNNNLDLAYAWVKVLEKSDNRTHQNQSIMLAPLMQTMGGGQDVISDKVLRTCKREQTPYCHHFLSQAITNITVQNIDILFDTNWKNKTVFPPLTHTALTQRINNGSLGNVLIYALSALQQSPYFEPYIIEALKTIHPFTVVRPLIIERHLYQ